MCDYSQYFCKNLIRRANANLHISVESNARENGNSENIDPRRSNISNCLKIFKKLNNKIYLQIWLQPIATILTKKINLYFENLTVRFHIF